jgi:protein-disulfide isomerase
MLAAAAVALGAGLPAMAAGPTVVPDDMSLGDPRAKVTLIEYGSASCPHCAHFNNDIFPAFKAKYVDTGRVRYVFREFLTDPVEVAAASFLVARCAGRDKYFSVLDAIFKAQQQMFQSGDVRGTLLHIAEGAGLSESQFDACVADPAALKALNERVGGYVTNDKISGTPTFFVNDVRMEGVQSLEALSAAVDQAEAAARDARTHHPAAG